MKSIKKIFAMALAVAMLVISATMFVCADTTTDLSDLKVYAVTDSGEKSLIKMDFNSTTYDYNLTIKSTAAKIEIVATPADSTSTAVVEKDGVNTVMDTGINKTTILVTSQAGVTNRYTLNTTKVAPAQDDTVSYASTKKKATKKDKKGKKEVKVKVGKKSFDITTFSKSDIPKGFKKTEAKYKGKKYDAIKGETKDLTAFYLTGSEPEGFYIYDKEKDEFYKMNNLKIKSRMLTVVKPSKPDSILKNYDKDTIKIDDKKVDVWVLNAEEGIYFVYCMNWDGKTRLYTYDKDEQNLQRYLVDEDVNAKVQAANDAFDNIKAKHNKMVKKYNVFRFIILGLAVLVIILAILLIHSLLRNKEKKITKENPNLADMSKKDAKKLAKDQKKAAKAAKEAEKLAAKEAKEAEKLAAKEAKEAEKLAAKEAKKAAKAEPEAFDPDDIDAPQEEVEDVVDATEDTDSSDIKEVADEDLAPTVDVDDIPEVGSNVDANADDAKESSDSEEIEIPSVEEDIVDVDDEEVENLELDLDSIAEQDDVQDTLKAMLNDDTEDDDEDFEFIDLD